ncbi:helix-turn-helix domain-containing protein [Streptomyces sasae]|uniref:helix-turn-helix domain-containing protein n=1 Tax=Streptomyces sasae TaxID=1266772 RepID=UPI003743857A
MGDARQLSPSAQEALRLRAVAALVAGRTREDVAAVFQVSLKAVDKWWAKWLAGGREALMAQPRGRRVGEHQVLDRGEEALRHYVGLYRPAQHGRGIRQARRRPLARPINSPTRPWSPSSITNAV